MPFCLVSDGSLRSVDVTRFSTMGLSVAQKKPNLSKTGPSRPCVYGGQNTTCMQWHHLLNMAQSASKSVISPRILMPPLPFLHAPAKYSCLTPVCLALIPLLSDLTTAGLVTNNVDRICSNPTSTMPVASRSCRTHLLNRIMSSDFSRSMESSLPATFLPL